MHVALKNAPGKHRKWKYLVYAEQLLDRPFLYFYKNFNQCK